MDPKSGQSGTGEWREVVMDAAAGKQYFYNKKLKISQWDRPCEQDAEIQPPPPIPSKAELR